MTERPPWEPPYAAGESEHLFGMLERLRWTFRWKTDGLGIDDLRRRTGVSELTIGGLLKHLAVVEDDIFAWKIAGERPETRSRVPDGVDSEVWQFTVGSDETAEAVYQLWDDAVARSRERMRAIADAGRLDEPSAMQFGEIRPSVRRFVCDLIEEYGRHTGHADLIREAIDGRVGEDPPFDWRP